MFSRTILSLAAIASIGAAALITSASPADARPGFRGGHKGGFGRFVHRGHFHHHRHWHVRHRPWIYGVGAAVIAAPAYGAVAAKPGPCARLATEYGRDNPMAFMDRCMKEMPPGGMPQGGMPQQQSEAPQQPGDAEPVPTK